MMREQTAATAPDEPSAELAWAFGLPRLRAAFERVAANRGAPGVDRQTVEQFGAHLDRNLARLADHVLSGRYRPGRSIYDAIDHVVRLRPGRLAWVAEGDILQCFDSLSHGRFVDLWDRRRLARLLRGEAQAYEAFRMER